MNNLEIDNIKLDLLKRSNNLLEKTKKNYKKYHEVRKLLLKLTNNDSINYDEWEKILVAIEELVRCEESKRGGI